MTLMTTFFGGRGKAARRKGKRKTARRSCCFEIRRNDWRERRNERGDLRWNRRERGPRGTGGTGGRRERERETRARKPGHFCRLRLPACCPSLIPRASAGEARHLQPSARFCPTWNPSPHWYPHISSALQAD